MVEPTVAAAQVVNGQLWVILNDQTECRSVPLAGTSLRHELLQELGQVPGSVQRLVAVTNGHMNVLKRVEWLSQRLELPIAVIGDALAISHFTPPMPQRDAPPPRYLCIVSDGREQGGYIRWYETEPTPRLLPIDYLGNQGPILRLMPDRPLSQAVSLLAAFLEYQASRLGQQDIPIVLSVPCQTSPIYGEGGAFRQFFDPLSRNRFVVTVQGPDATLRGAIRAAIRGHI